MLLLLNNTKVVVAPNERTSSSAAAAAVLFLLPPRFTVAAAAPQADHSEHLGCGGDKRGGKEEDRASGPLHSHRLLAAGRPPLTVPCSWVSPLRVSASTTVLVVVLLCGWQPGTPVAEEQKSGCGARVSVRSRCVSSGTSTTAH